MDRLTVAETVYNTKKRKTHREKFLEQVEGLIPWKQLKRIMQHDHKKRSKMATL